MKSDDPMTPSVARYLDRRGTPQLDDERFFTAPLTEAELISLLENKPERHRHRMTSWDWFVRAMFAVLASLLLVVVWYLGR